MPRPKGSGLLKEFGFHEAIYDFMEEMGWSNKFAYRKFGWGEPVGLEPGIPEYELSNIFRRNNNMNLHARWVKEISWSLYQYAKSINWPRADELHPNNQYLPKEKEHVSTDIQQ